MNLPIAHSADPNRGVSDQPYPLHIKGMLDRFDEVLSYIKPHVSENMYHCIVSVIIPAIYYHDIGKLHPQAQKRMKGEIQDKMINHVDPGVAILFDLYEKTGHRYYKWAAIVVYSHHIGLPNINEITNTDGTINVDTLRDNSCSSKYNITPHRSVKEIFDDMLDYLKMQSKKSNEAYNLDLDFSDSKLFKDSCDKTDLDGVESSEFFRLLMSILTHTDHSDTTIWYKGPHISSRYKSNLDKRVNKALELIKSLSEDAQSKNIHPDTIAKRKMLLKACLEFEFNSRFTSIDATVGTGKTLSGIVAALRAAQHFGCDKIVYGLPFISIIQQNVEVMRDVLVLDGENRKYCVTEINCQNEYLIAKNGSNKEDFSFHLKHFSKSFSGFGNVCTSVNVFESLASNNPTRLKKFHTMAGSVFILDEYHSMMPAEFWDITLRWIKWMAENMNCVFIFMSGSPVDFDQIDFFSEYDGIEIDRILSDEQREYFYELEKKRIQYEKIDGKLNEGQIESRILSEYNSNKSVIAVFNTKKNAAIVARELNGRLPSGKVFCLSNALRASDKKKVIKSIEEALDAGEKVICIATSCIEAGVDLSFGVGFREVAKFSSIIQTGGRVNRNQEQDNPATMYVFDLNKNRDSAYSNNPLLKEDVDITYDILEELELAADYSSEAFNRELERLNPKRRRKIRNIKRNDEIQNLYYVKKDYRLINDMSVSVIVDDYIIADLEAGNLDNLFGLDRYAVNIYNQGRYEDFIESVEINGDTVYYWTGRYDDFLGIFAETDLFS